MVTRKQKKSRKLRASRTHGWGFGKKHRGAGNRGGRGKAGILGKRGSHRKNILFVKGGEKYLPRKGFKSLRDAPKTINLAVIEQRIDSWIAAKKASVEKGVIVLDLNELGYQKLLGNGEVTRKFKVKVSSISKSAKDKILKAGGAIVENNKVREEVE